MRGSAITLGRGLLKRPRLTARGALVGAFLLAVFAFYIWTATTGFNPIHFRDHQPDRYNELSDALLHGRAALLTPPPPGLLALKDPYDPVANANFRLGGVHDLSLYHGRFYLYWGPTPAVTLFIPWRVLPFGQMPEALAVAIYAFAGLIFTLLLLRFLVERYLPQTPFWMRFLGVVALSVGNTAPFVLRRPAVYEVAIAAGYCFAVAGLYFLLTGALRERPSNGRLLAGSACLGLAIGARPPQLLAGLVTVVVLGLLVRSGKLRERRDLVRTGAALLGPIFVAGVLLLIYNKVRFDSFTEFGQRYQLAGVEVSKKKMFDFAYIPPGLYYYLLAPVRWALAFPFAFLPPPPALGGVPASYDGVELTGGLISNVPILLALGAVPFLARGAAPGSRQLWWIVGGLVALAFALTLLVSWTLWGATMRYEMDFSSLVVVAALLAWFALALGFRGSRWRYRLVTGVGTVFVAYGVIVGLAIGFVGYDQSLRLTHPHLFRSLVHFFSPLPTLTTVAAGHAVISDVFSPGGYALDHINYGTTTASGATFSVGSDPSTVDVISPDSRNIVLEGTLTKGQNLPPNASVTLQASDSRSLVRAPVAGQLVRLPMKVHGGLNEISFRALTSPRLPSSPPVAQLYVVNHLVIIGQSG